MTTDKEKWFLVHHGSTSQMKPHLLDVVSKQHITGKTLSRPDIPPEMHDDVVKTFMNSPKYNSVPLERSPMIHSPHLSDKTFKDMVLDTGAIMIGDPTEHVKKLTSDPRFVDMMRNNEHGSGFHLIGLKHSTALTDDIINKSLDGSGSEKASIIQNASVPEHHIMSRLIGDDGKISEKAHGIAHYINPYKRKLSPESIERLKGAIAKTEPDHPSAVNIPLIKTVVDNHRRYDEIKKRDAEIRDAASHETGR